MTTKFQPATWLWLRLPAILLMLVAMLLQPTQSTYAQSGTLVYAVTASNQLLQFNSTAPGTILSANAISGLQSGESVLGIDFRPANGRLYAVGSSNRIYTIQPQTGAASLVAIQPLSPTLQGAAFAVDFNPIPDRIRVLSDEEQNLRLHPISGTVAGIDTTLAFTDTDPNSGANPQIVAAAYTNNVSGTPTTTLYAIDANLDILVTQGGINGTPSPNGGRLFTVGSLGVDVGTQAGFDISPTGVALASITAPGGSSSDLYSIDVSTGRATMIGNIGGGEVIVGLAMPTVPPLPLPQETIYAATSANRLIQFNSTTPDTLITSKDILGLQSGETVVGIDFRPANGRLYAVGSRSRIYIIEPTSGVATMVGSQVLSPTLAGTAFGVDFNPVPDRIRLVSNDEQNLRLHPISGTVAGIDTRLAYTPTDVNSGANPRIVAAGYTNNISGATSTTLYVIDADLDILATQGGVNGVPSPNGGGLFTVGKLGVDTSDLTSFDISPTGNAFAALTTPGGTTSDLALVNLANGLVTRIGAIAGGETIVGIAVPTLATLPPSLNTTITIVKNAQPQAATDFQFHGAFGSFLLDDPASDDGDGVAKSITYNVAAGDYNFSEATQRGWFLSDISCTGGEFSANLRGRTVNVRPKMGDQIVCTFTNQLRGRITVVKYNDLNGNGTQEIGEPVLPNWGIQLFGSQFSAPIFNVTNAAGTVTYINLQPISYKVCEVQKAGWNNSQPGTIDPATDQPCYSLTLTPGQDVTLFFGNTTTPTNNVGAGEQNRIDTMAFNILSPDAQMPADAIDTSIYEESAGSSVYMPMIVR